MIKFAWNWGFIHFHVIGYGSASILRRFSIFLLLRGFGYEGV